MIDHDRLDCPFGEVGVVGMFMIVHMAVGMIVGVPVIIVMMMVVVVTTFDVNFVRTASAYLAHDPILPPGL
jgi:hypothetical protein